VVLFIDIHVRVHAAKEVRSLAGALVKFDVLMECWEVVALLNFFLDLFRSGFSIFNFLPFLRRQSLMLKLTLFDLLNAALILN
jgi:hypothetical protein